MTEFENEFPEIAKEYFDLKFSDYLKKSDFTTHVNMWFASMKFGMESMFYYKSSLNKKI